MSIKHDQNKQLRYRGELRFCLKFLLYPLFLQGHVFTDEIVDDCY